MHCCPIPCHPSLVGWRVLGRGLGEGWGPLTCLEIINNRKGVLTQIFITPSHSFITPPNSPEWGRGDPGSPGESKAAEMSHQERERERERQTEMRRDTERQLLERLGKENTP